MAYPHNYGVDTAINEISHGKVTNVTFTESGGVIKEIPMSNGGSKVQISEPVNSSKGYITADYYYDKDGNFSSYSQHKG